MPSPLCLAERATPSLRGGPCLVSLSWIVREHRLGVQAEPVIFDSSIFMSLLPPMRYPVAFNEPRNSARATQVCHIPQPALSPHWRFL